jgi:hypothetical protein
MSRVLLFAAATFAVACASAPAQPASSVLVAASRPASDTQVRIRSESFSPATSDSALRAFKPHAQPVDSAGQCAVRRSSGNGSTIVSASFQGANSTGTTTTLSFDSVGHLVRFTDAWGSPRIRPAPGASREQLDSAFSRVSRSIRMTSITLDWSVDQAMVFNSGGGEPTVAVTSSVRAVENLPQLGPPTKRIQFIRKFCGV